MVGFRDQVANIDHSMTSRATDPASSVWRDPGEPDAPAEDSPGVIYGTAAVSAATAPARPPAGVAPPSSLVSLLAR